MVGGNEVEAETEVDAWAETTFKVEVGSAASGEMEEEMQEDPALETFANALAEAFSEDSLDLLRVNRHYLDFIRARLGRGDDRTSARAELGRGAAHRVQGGWRDYFFVLHQ